MQIKDGDRVVANIIGKHPNIQGCEEGLWIELVTDDGTKPTLCLVRDKVGDYSTSWYLGVYRDAGAKDVLSGCDLAVSFPAIGGPVLQIRSGDQVKIVNLFDLLAKIG